MRETIPTGYLESLGEQKDLETLLEDLIKGIGLRVISRPQKGPRQNGVDMAAIGVDPEDGIKKLFLFVIKSGDISRKKWHGDEQGIHASLDQIFDVYLRSCISAEHNDLPILIAVVTGGVLLQNCQGDWAGYTNTHSNKQQLIVLWDGDYLADLIDKYRLGEALIPRNARKAFRRLLLFDENEPTASSSFDKITKELLGPDITLNDIEKACQQIAIILDLMAKWGNANNSLRQAWLCSERALLHTWEWGRINQQFKSAKYLKGFGAVYEAYFSIGSEYVGRLLPHCCTKDGLSKTHDHLNSIEYHLWLYDIMGHIATFALNLINTPDTPTHFQSAFENCARTLASLIDKHSLAESPAYDGHITEIAATLIVMKGTKETQSFAKNWMKDMLARIQFAYEAVGHGYPVDIDNVDTLIKSKHGGKSNRQQYTRLSTLFPIFAELCIVYDDKETYAQLLKLIHDVFPHTCLQMWHPNEQTDDKLYVSNAGIETGFICAEIQLPETLSDLKNEIIEMSPRLWDANQLTCVENKFALLAWISARHYRTPLIPLLWRQHFMPSTK